MTSSYRTTILLAVIFAGLGLYLYTIEIPIMEHEAFQQQESQRLLPFDYRDVTELRMTTRTETSRLVRDHRHRWRIVDPVQAKGDSREVDTILRALEIGKISRVIQQGAKDLAHYGLESPKMAFELTAAGQSETILLGDVSPLTSTLYAQRESDKQILLTTLSVTDFRRKTLFTFRHKDLMFFDRTMVKHIQLTRASQQITLHRVASRHAPTDTWRFSVPFEGTADSTSVGLLLMTLENLSATGFIDAQSDKGAFLKRAPRPILTATVETGRREHRVMFFQLSEHSNMAYAITSDDAPIYKISPAILERLPQQAFDLQEKRLFGMSMAEIGLLTVTTPSMTLTAVQQHGTWYLDHAPDQSINQQEITLFVSRVVDLPAEFLVSRTKENLGHFGLTSPVIEITGVDTRGRQRGYLALGNKGDGLVYATGAGLPGVYQARSLIFTQLPAHVTNGLLRETPL